MGLPPVIERELRLRAGQSKTWWIRIAVVLLPFLTWIAPMAMGLSSYIQGMGGMFALSFIPVCVASFSGVLTTADCISREKRDGTLGLLLLTPLPPIEIVLQKFVAATAPVYSGLLAVLPIFFFAIFVGGITGTAASAVMLLTVGAALISGALGCLVSVLSRSILVSTGATFIIAASFFGTCLIPGLDQSNSTLLQILAAINPLHLYTSILFVPIMNVGFGSVLLCFASCILIASFLLCSAAVLLQLVVHASPLIVLQKKRLRYALVILGPAAGVLLAIPFGSNVLLLALAIYISSTAKLLVVLEAVRILSAREWIELIVTTPLNPLDYVRQELRRNSRLLATVLATSTTANVLIVSRLNSPFFEAGIAVIAFLILDAVALLYAGLWNGLKQRTVNQAISFSLTSVYLIPLSIAAICVAFGFKTETLPGGLVLWAILCLIVDLLAACSANWMLHHRFRLAAST